MRHVRKNLCLFVLVVVYSFGIPFQIEAAGLPSSKDVIDYSFTGFCTEWLCQIHEAKSVNERRISAQAYYGSLFIMWFGSANPKVPRVFDYDISGNVKAFLQKSASMHFKDLINFDDPLNKRKISKEMYKLLIESFGGSQYYRWVLLECEDDTSYNKNVAQFRTFIENIKK